MKLPHWHPFRTPLVFFVLIVGGILLYLEIQQRFQ